MKIFFRGMVLAAAMMAPSLPAWAGLSGSEAVQAEVNASATLARQNLINLGIDPASPLGQLMLNWFGRVQADPAWAKFRDPATGAVRIPDAKTSLQYLPSEQRLQMLKILFDTPTPGGDGGCSAVLAMQGKPSPTMFGNWLKQMPLESVDTYLHILDSVVHALAVSAKPADSYTTAQLLEADNYLNVQLLEWMKLNAKNVQTPSSNMACQLLSSMMKVLEAAPADMQSRLTWEMAVQSVRGGATIVQVVNHPLDYASEAFDQPALPDEMRSSLPAAGTQSLPFHKLVVHAKWSNDKTPLVNGPIVLTFINTQNSGVVTQILQAMPLGQGWRFAAIESDYGLLTLKTQDLDLQVTMPDASLIPASAYRSFVQTRPKPGGHYDIPIAQPSPEGATIQSCDAGSEYPAAQLAPNLTGKALELSCKDMAGSTVKSQGRFAYLDDYGIDILLETISDNGVTSTAIDSITVEP